jgi:hypothetical protein
MVVEMLNVENGLTLNRTPFYEEKIKQYRHPQNKPYTDITESPMIFFFPVQ